MPLEDPVGEGTRRSTAPRRSYLSVPQRKAQYAERCLRQGRSIRRAVRVTNSSTPSDATSPAVRQQLNDLHPSAAPPPFLEEEEAALQLSLEQFQAAVAAIAAHHRGSAAGPSGWTLEMICTACQSSDAATLAVLGVVNLILSGELPRETFLLDSNLIGLDKPDGGVRPIAIGEAWYRFAGICALRECGRDIGAGLAPLQLGVGTRGGTETVVHALSSALAEGHAVFAIDMRNAFNTVSRQAILEAVKEHAAPLLPMVQWAYGRPTALHIVGAPPGTPPVMSETGVRQGDPLGPFLFTLALQSVLQRVAGGCPDAPLAAYLDDVHIAGSVAAGAAAFRRLCFAPDGVRSIGLEPRLDKCGVHGGGAGEAATAAADLGIKDMSRGMTAVGTPLGALEYIDEVLSARASAVEEQIKVLESLPLSLQSKFLLLRVSMHARMAHLLRTVPRESLEAHVRRTDMAVYRAVERMFGLPPDVAVWAAGTAADEEQADPCFTPLVNRLHAPLRDGGFGLAVFSR